MHHAQVWEVYRCVGARGVACAVRGRYTTIYACLPCTCRLLTPMPLTPFAVARDGWRQGWLPSVSSDWCCVSFLW